MYERDVFDVTIFDRNGNELYCTHIATYDRTVDWLADECLSCPESWTATVRGQHGQYGEVNLAELHDRLLAEGYMY